MPVKNVTLHAQSKRSSSRSNASPKNDLTFDFLYLLGLPARFGLLSPPGRMTGLETGGPLSGGHLFQNVQRRTVRPARQLVARVVNHQRRAHPAITTGDNFGYPVHTLRPYAVPSA
jgi:hypothetical protein